MPLHKFVTCFLLYRDIIIIYLHLTSYDKNMTPTAIELSPNIAWLSGITITQFSESYVYWAVHHLDSWIKRDQLDVTCCIISLFTAQHVSDVNTSILRSLRLIWWVISWVVLLWYDVCWCYAVVWLGWCGIRMQAEACIRIQSMR